MHRVFRGGESPETIGDRSAALRAYLRSVGLAEQLIAGSWAYLWDEGGGTLRQFATLHGRGRHVTIYLYPDALGRPRGVATDFYLALDAAGLNLGSKLGPSIGIDLDDAAQVQLFCDGLAAVLVRPAHNRTSRAE